MKEYLLNIIQKNFKCGNKMTDSLRKETYEIDGGATKSVWSTVTVPENPFKHEIAELKIEQDGYDLGYVDDLKSYI